MVHCVSEKIAKIFLGRKKFFFLVCLISHFFKRVQIGPVCLIGTTADNGDIL